MSSQFEPRPQLAMPDTVAMDSHPVEPLGTVQHLSPDNQQLADDLDHIAAGDRGRFEALYQLTAPRLWAVVRRMVVFKQPAEDVLQETYLTIWRKAHLFDRSAGEALGWMTTIARHCAIAWMRQADNATRHVYAGPPSQDDAEATAADATEESVLFKQLLDKLPYEQRESLRLVYLYGMTQEEVGIALGVPLGTIKSRIRRGLIALKDLLSS
jgi:RNA polymerase sigma-70 factor (ECF subfamily)